MMLRTHPTPYGNGQGSRQGYHRGDRDHGNGRNFNTQTARNEIGSSSRRSTRQQRPEQREKASSLTQGSQTLHHA